MLILCIDRPFTDLYDTEGTGGFPGVTFMARPVVGGTFAFLTLERACGGKAMEGLEFLDEGDSLKDLLEDLIENKRNRHEDRPRNPNRHD